LISVFVFINHFSHLSSQSCIISATIKIHICFL
jgi:hypothetical protein